MLAVTWYCQLPALGVPSSFWGSPKEECGRLISSNGDKSLLNSCYLGKATVTESSTSSTKVNNVTERSHIVPPSNRFSNSFVPRGTIAMPSTIWGLVLLGATVVDLADAGFDWGAGCEGGSGTFKTSLNTVGQW
jgi:hypothetical protein